MHSVFAVTTWKSPKSVDDDDDDDDDDTIHSNNS